jgi:hypothetical protein
MAQGMNRCCVLTGNRRPPSNPGIVSENALLVAVILHRTVST